MELYHSNSMREVILGEHAMVRANIGSRKKKIKNQNPFLTRKDYYVCMDGAILIMVYSTWACLSFP